MTEIDERLTQRAEEIERRARDRYGNDGWSDRLQALDKVGVNGPALAEVVKRDDALDLLEHASYEALCREASNVGPNGEWKPYDRAAEERLTRAREKRLEGRRR